jgi:2-polyprenyl-3-methyl-5-hydroxy-6-metoxy-1,4-benzoquinol methylase
MPARLNQLFQKGYAGIFDMISNRSEPDGKNKEARESMREYWNQNINRWGELYLEISHSKEEFIAPTWLEFLYHKTITPIEAKLMTKRYNLTMKFIHDNINEKTVAVDLGCGTGIFTVEILKMGASVVAVDYAQASLALTKKLVEEIVPDAISRIKYLPADITYQSLPPSDVVLVMGVTPYVTNITSFLENILPNTKMLYCLFLDDKHWANRLRKYFPILNVRKLEFFDRNFIDEQYQKHQWKLISRNNFATGYIDLAVNGKYANE